MDLRVLLEWVGEVEGEDGIFSHDDIVIAESMSCGVPVITTKYCPWEILNETNTGWWIDLSVDKLSDCLRNAMCMDFSMLFDMGQRASKLVHEKFDYRNVAKITLQMYESLIDY